MDNKIPDLPPFYSRYIQLVVGAALPGELKNSGEILYDYASCWTKEQANFRYAPGKWSAREVLLHLIDAERIFASRALRFARADQTRLPGFDENKYAEHYKEDERSLQEILFEMKALRESTVAMFSSFSPQMLERQGEASNVRLSVRSIGEIIAGHEMHHLKVLKLKYFPN